MTSVSSSDETSIIEAMARAIYDGWWDDETPDESAKWENLEPGTDVVFIRAGHLEFGTVVGNTDDIGRYLVKKGDSYLRVLHSALAPASEAPTPPF